MLQLGIKGFGLMLNQITKRSSVSQNGYSPRLLLALGLTLWVSGCVILNYGIGSAVVGNVPLFGLMSGISLLSAVCSPHLPLRFLFPLVLLWTWTLFRFSLGPWTFYAVRDTSAILGTVWLLAGWFSGLELPRGLFVALSRWTLLILLAYWSLSPFAESLMEISPSTGLYGGSILGSYVNQALVGPVMVAILVFREILGKLIIVLSLPICVFFCLSTMSRGAITNLILGMMWFIGFHRERPWPLIFIGLLSLFLFVLLLLVFEAETRYGRLNLELLVGIPYSMVGIETDERLYGASGGLEQRLNWWQSGLGMLNDHPWGWVLGIGYGEPLTDHGNITFTTGSAVVTRELHNSWISQLCRGGIISFVLLLYLYARIFGELILKKESWRSPSGILYGSLCIAFSILTLTEPGLENPHYAVILWFGLGFGLARQSQTKSH